MNHPEQIDKVMNTTCVPTGDSQYLAGIDDNDPYRTIDVDGLPKIESLQMATSKKNLYFPHGSVFENLTLSETRALISDYHAAESANAFIYEKGFGFHANQFGYHLPSIFYLRARPCLKCKINYVFLRKVSSRSHLNTGHHGYLECAHCEHCRYLDFSSAPRARFNRALSIAVASSESSQAESLEKSSTFRFVRALLNRYVPEYQHQPILEYLLGKTSLERVQQKTNIWLSEEPIDSSDV